MRLAANAASRLFLETENRERERAAETGEVLLAHCANSGAAVEFEGGTGGSQQSR